MMLKCLLIIHNYLYLINSFMFKFIRKIEEIASTCGYRLIEPC
jgi:hypothetical protein